MIITIDGPVGTGKSTIAKKVADALGFEFVDTGAMYRCLTFAIDKQGVKDLPPFLSSFSFEIKKENGKKRYFYENEDITDKIRQEGVTSKVSQISAIPEVRETLIDLQRHLGKQGNMVFEGRDMGTVVFPDAELKIYLTASPEIRAQRRHQEMLEKFPDTHPTYETILNQVIERDRRDTTRELSPLIPAKDSHVIDSTNLSIEEVLNEILLLFKNYAERDSL